MISHSIIDSVRDYSTTNSDWNIKHAGNAQI